MKGKKQTQVPPPLGKQSAASGQLCHYPGFGSSKASPLAQLTQ